MDSCIICGGTEAGCLLKLREKGSRGINIASKKRRDTLNAIPGQSVHLDCRKNYTNPILINKYLKDSLNNGQPDDTSVKLLRSKDVFSFPDHCLFCGCQAKNNNLKRGNDVFPVRTHDFQASIIDICLERQDEWSDTVYGRIQSVNDLHAADAIYHQTCSVNFRTKKNVPSAFSTPSKEIKKGRRVDAKVQQAFEDIFIYLEDHENDQHKLSDLVDRMGRLCGNEAYEPWYLKKKLQDRFGRDIIMTESHGKSTIITVRKAAESILHDFHKQKFKDAKEEEISVISTAAKLIKSKIQELPTQNDFYPLPSELEKCNYNISHLPEHLSKFLQQICGERNDLRTAAIGQCITQATRPRSYTAPLQIGLGVQLHHHFASRFLIDTLHNLGFCSSYSEVQRFETSAAYSQGTDIPEYKPGQCVQFVADNVDHNLRTIDGHNTFHGMGIIAGSTPGGDAGQTPVPKLNVVPSDLILKGKINITYYKAPPKSSIKIVFPKLKLEKIEDSTKNLDMVARIIWPLRAPTPSWSGLMHMCQTGQHPGKTTITFLPMIDMDSSDMSCIYSTMVFIVNQAQKYGFTPIITFDQPLYWKALTIINDGTTSNILSTVILRLGGFHAEMSFMGSIGHVMKNAGLKEVLETVYASNAVTHILSGKSVARAFRAHNLVETALHVLLVQKVFGVSFSERSDDEECNSDVALTLNASPESSRNLTKVSSLYDDLLNGNITTDHVCNDVDVKSLLQEYLNGISNLQMSKTSQLWLQYLEMVELLRTFIKAERTGNWDMHLQTIRLMLPYFAATGHNLYAKSIYMYLASMEGLKHSHPEVYEYFSHGYHVFRRSDRFGPDCQLIWQLNRF
ncbi:hypothetical protein FSP39_014885 [Pinctada imbricata]|uniref:Uncharacterized protein n=1 Tax=Pinctada imbricata TaxID=66713 RepID=A0AA88YF44_PINIB|nr:hypothetical protein FSP39_014885 [Pinctada imbricata]